MMGDDQIVIQKEHYIFEFRAYCLLFVMFK